MASKAQKEGREISFAENIARKDSTTPVPEAETAICAMQTTISHSGSFTIGEDPWRTLYRSLPLDVYEMLCRIEDRLGALHKTGPFPAHGRSDTRYKEVFAHTWRYFVTRIEELDEDTFRRLFE